MFVSMVTYVRACDRSLRAYLCTMFDMHNYRPLSTAQVLLQNTDHADLFLYYILHSCHTHKESYVNCTNIIVLEKIENSNSVVCVYFLH